MSRILAVLFVGAVVADEGLRGPPEPNAEAMVEALNGVQKYLKLDDDAVHDNLQPAFEKIEVT